jgi:nucleoside-diphosphate-sugar epimerase
MHLVFLGGTRFIGHAACAAALSAGHRVTRIHRGTRRSDLPGAKDVIADRRDPSALAVALAKTKPDAVIDTWAMTKAGAECAALGIKLLGVPAVVLSSQDVYAQFGKLNGLPAPAEDDALVGEDAPLTVPRPFAALGEHEGGPEYDKKDVEAVYRALAAETHAPVAALRLPGVYGARDPRRRFGAIVDALDAGITVLACAGGASLRLTHVHVADAAHAFGLAATRAPAGFRAFNVGEAETPPMRDRATALAAFMGKPLELREQAPSSDANEPDVPDDRPQPLGLLGRFPNDCVMNTSRIRNELGYREILDEEQRLTDLVAWLRASRGEGTNAR